MAQHLIFEGAELAGKSWLISQIYNYLEPKYNQNKAILDGCHWFNCDIGIYGTKHGKAVIENYLRIFKELEERNLIVEKLHISDIVYNRMYNSLEVDYGPDEDILMKLGFKIILITFPCDKNLIKKRIEDRLKIYPHYERILHDPSWYFEQQDLYLKEIAKTKLPYLIVEAVDLPNMSLVGEVLDWIGEK